MWTDYSTKYPHNFNMFVCIFSLSDESEYELHDEEFEDKFSCDLKGLLQAKDRDKLFTVRDPAEKLWN